MAGVVEAGSLRPLRLRSCSVVARVKGLAAEAIVNLAYSNDGPTGTHVLLLCPGEAAGPWSLVGLQAVCGGRAVSSQLLEAGAWGDGGTGGGATHTDTGDLHTGPSLPHHAPVLPEGVQAFPLPRMPPSSRISVTLRMVAELGASRDGRAVCVELPPVPRPVPPAAHGLSATDTEDHDFSFVMEACGHCLLAGVDSSSGDAVRVDAAPCAPCARSVFVTLLPRVPHAGPVHIRLHPSETNVPYVLTERGEMTSEEYAEQVDSARLWRLAGCPGRLYNALRRRMYRDVMLLPAVMLAFSPALLDQPDRAPPHPLGTPLPPPGPHPELIFIVDRGLVDGGGGAHNVKEAMTVLLKSLPVHCHFNVVSYSSSFQLLFAHSRPYNDETLEKACRFIRRLRGETSLPSDPVGPLAWALGVGTKCPAPAAGTDLGGNSLDGVTLGDSPHGGSSLGSPDGATQGGMSLCGVTQGNYPPGRPSFGVRDGATPLWWDSFGGVTQWDSPPGPQLFGARDGATTLCVDSPDGVTLAGVATAHEAGDPGSGHETRSPPILSPRQLFLLSGPGGADAGQVLSMARVYGRGTRCFTFTVGGGVAPPRSLATLAALSRGHAEVIQLAERIQPKLLRGLKLALEPSLSSVSVEWRLPPGVIALTAAPPPPCLFPGDSITAFAFLCDSSTFTAHGSAHIHGPAHGHAHTQTQEPETEFTPPGIGVGKRMQRQGSNSGNPPCAPGSDRTKGSRPDPEVEQLKQGVGEVATTTERRGRYARAASVERLPGSPRVPAGFSRSVSTPDGRARHKPHRSSTATATPAPLPACSGAARSGPQGAGSLVFLPALSEDEGRAREAPSVATPLGEPKQQHPCHSKTASCKRRATQPPTPDRQTFEADHHHKPGSDPHQPSDINKLRREADFFPDGGTDPDVGSGRAVVRAVFCGRPVRWEARFDVWALMGERPAGDGEAGGQIHLLAARALARELERKAERDAADAGRSRRWAALAGRVCRASGVPCRLSPLTTVDVGSGARLAFPGNVASNADPGTAGDDPAPRLPSAPSQSSLDGLLTSRLVRRCSQVLHKASCPGLWKAPSRTPLAPRAEDDPGTPAYATLLELQEAEGSFALSLEFAAAVGVPLEQLARSSPFASLRQLAHQSSVSHANPSALGLTGFQPASGPAGAHHQQLMEQVASAFSWAASPPTTARDQGGPPTASPTSSPRDDPAFLPCDGANSAEDLPESREGPHGRAERGERRRRPAGSREAPPHAEPKVRPRASREVKARAAETAGSADELSLGEPRSQSDGAFDGSAGRRVKGGGTNRKASWEIRAAANEERGETYVDWLVGDGHDSDDDTDNDNRGNDDPDNNRDKIRANYDSDRYNDTDRSNDDERSDDDREANRADDTYGDHGLTAPAWLCGGGEGAGRVWATAVGLAWLESNCAAHLHEWELAAGKAQRWLSGRAGHAGVGEAALRAAARQLLLMLRHWDRKLDFTLLCYNRGSS